MNKYQDGAQIVIQGKVYKVVKEDGDRCCRCAFNDGDICCCDIEVMKATLDCYTEGVIFIEMEKGGEK